MGRRWRCWTVLALCAVAGGCWTRGERPPASAVARSLAPLQPSEGVYVESLILERPAGDPFLEDELWKAAQPVGAPEARALLSENGLRAAVLSGALPPRFQKMLDSEAEAVGGRGLTFANRKEEVLPTSGPYDECKFGYLSDLAGRRADVVLRQARCGIQVRPEPLPDRRVRVSCEPQIQHGERRDWFRASGDATALVRHEEIPLVRYVPLGFEVALGRHDYLLIGCEAGAANTLGAALFRAETGGQPRQRVLVIRARELGAGSPDLPALGNANRRPSVAAEAGRPRP